MQFSHVIIYSLKIIFKKWEERQNKLKKCNQLFYSIQFHERSLIQIVLFFLPKGQLDDKRRGKQGEGGSSKQQLRAELDGCMQGGEGCCGGFGGTRGRGGYWFAM